MKSVLTVLILAALLAIAPRSAAAQTTPPRPSLVDWRVTVSGLHSNVPCEGDSILVTITGKLPNGCWRIRRVDVQELLCILPCAPLIRVLLDDGACNLMICDTVPVPDTVTVVYGPLVAGPTYRQNVELYRATCTDSFPNAPWGVAGAPFGVLPDSLCSPLPPGGCVIPSWSDQDGTSECDAMVGPDGRGRIAMRLFHDTPLQAVQGEFTLGFPRRDTTNGDSLTIVSVTPIGPAGGMTMVWERTPFGGAKFVMFFADGRTLPPTLDRVLPPEIVAIGLATPHGGPPPRRAYINAIDVIGAEPDGDELGDCRLGPLYRPGILCGPQPSACDFNDDGRTSVRDLVLMLRCLHSRGCLTPFDCDGDDRSTLEDVICCARRLLLSAPPSREPGAAAPNTRIHLGDAAPIAGGWRVPLRIEGLGDLGAAQLALRFPGDRYEVTAITRVDGPASWMPLHEIAGDDLALGLLNLMEAENPLGPSSALEVAIQLRLREGATPGGELEIVSGEFSTTEGAALDVPLAGQVLAMPAGLRLSASRPNPFSTATALSLSFDRAADVRVTVHDLSGRRVATLFAGRFEPGSRKLAWKGVDDRGNRVPDGVYFVRCAAEGQVASQKLVLMKSR